MKKTIAAAALVAVLATAAFIRSAAGGRTFQLVYHSDTRGYYAPCG